MVLSISLLSPSLKLKFREVQRWMCGFNRGDIRVLFHPSTNGFVSVVEHTSFVDQSLVHVTIVVYLRCARRVGKARGGRNGEGGRERRMGILALVLWTTMSFYGVGRFPLRILHSRFN